MLLNMLIWAKVSFKNKCPINTFWNISYNEIESIRPNLSATISKNDDSEKSSAAKLLHVHLVTIRELVELIDSFDLKIDKVSAFAHKSYKLSVRFIFRTNIYVIESAGKYTLHINMKSHWNIIQIHYHKNISVCPI